MDQFMVNVGDDDIKVGDEVILLGEGIRRRGSGPMDGHERIRSDDEHQRACAARVCERVTPLASFEIPDASGVMVEWGDFLLR